MSYWNRTPAEDFLYRHGSMRAYRELSEADQKLLGPPQFPVGSRIVVLNPWWWKNRVGEQVKARLVCIVTENPGYWHPQRGDRPHGYYFSVRDADNPGAHGRSIFEHDVEGFVPNELNPAKPALTGLV